MAARDSIILINGNRPLVQYACSIFGSIFLRLPSSSTALLGISIVMILQSALLVIRNHLEELFPVDTICFSCQA